MAIETAFRDLSKTLGDLEDAGLSVTGVASDAEEIVTDDGVTVTVSAATGLLDELDLDSIEVEPREATVLEDGRIEVELDVRIPLEDAADGEAEGSGTAEEGSTVDEASEADADGEGETPVHRDPERLRAAYEDYDSFAEMKEALGTDVTAQTVRRNMIKHGIHEPETNGEESSTDDAAETADATGDDAGEEESDTRAGAEDEAGTETTMADGIDLPAGVSLDDVKEAVRTSHTLREVRREIGVDRERGRRLLEELDLLELVTGRLSKADREVTPEEIDERVRRATPGGS